MIDNAFQRMIQNHSYPLGTTASDMENFVGAVDCFGDAVRMDPSRGDCRVAQGSLREARGENR